MHATDPSSPHLISHACWWCGVLAVMGPAGATMKNEVCTIPLAHADTSTHQRLQAAIRLHACMHDFLIPNATWSYVHTPE
jgi:hypothetical protein